MPGDEDFIMRPVVEGLCSYTCMIDGSIDAIDVLIMNDALTAKNENIRRMREKL